MIIQILHTLLKPNLPTMHLRRFKALMAAVESGLRGSIGHYHCTSSGGIGRDADQTQNQARGSLDGKFSS